MDDLTARLRAAIDVQFDATDWPHRPKCQMLKPVAEGFPFPTFSCNCDATTLWMNTLDAHRKMLDMFERTREISEAASARIRVNPAAASSTDLRDWTNAHNELTVMRVFLEFLAEAYGVEP